MRNYDRKDISDSVLDVDDKSRNVKVVISKMGNLDHDNDIIDRGAYSKTLKERGPAGSNLIWHLTDHNPSLKSAVGKFKEISVVGDDLVGLTSIPNTTWGNDVLEFYKSGTINQHSIGFKIVKAEPVNKGRTDEYRLIKEVFLYEGSAVLWGANDQTPTLSVGKSATQEDIQKDFFAAVEELTKFTTLFKKGHLSDSSYELIEIRIAQITDKLKQLYQETTPPAVEAVEPEQGKRLLDVFDAFNNSLKLQYNGRKTTPAAT